MPREVVDSKYYQVVKPSSLAERVVVAARNRIYADFMAYCRPAPSDRILDVGVSDVVNDAANVLERLYPFPDRITAAGLGDGRDFKSAHPDVAYVRIDASKPLPFADKAFDIATTNAVLEHVGSVDKQRAFVAELMRVARQVLITVPHRYFPIEHHTAIPLLHFSDATFRLACRGLGKLEWTDPANLILMTRARLRSLVPADRSSNVAYTGLRLGPFSSNLLMHVAPDR
jgi:Methyltransferase domain